MTGPAVDRERIREVVHALLLEWTLDVEVHRGRDFVDFVTTSLGPLGQPMRQRCRLWWDVPSSTEVDAFRAFATGRHESPALVLPGARAPLSSVATIDSDALAGLIEESSVVDASNDGGWQIDAAALGDLADNGDTRLALVNGLLWLRPLGRNRVPPSLRATGRPAHELFERAFFTVMTSTFAARGTSWGTEKRGQVRPDGVLALPNAATLTIYDCKASFQGYSPSYRDILGFADYVVKPSGWAPPPGAPPRFLIVSSRFRMARTGSHSRRRQQLLRKAPGVELVTISARDLARFGLAIERSNLSMEGRLSVDWDAILAAGEVDWAQFESQLAALAVAGHSVVTP